MDGPLFEGEPLELGKRLVLSRGIFKREIIHSDGPTTSCIIFVPGLSGDAERYDEIVEELNEQGFDVLRFGGWKRIEDFDTARIHDVLIALEDTVKLLIERGYVFIGYLGKSFGGMLGLLGRGIGIERVVLWAPVIGYAQETSDTNTKLTSLSRLTDISISEDELRTRTTPILIIAGSEDEVLSIERAERITDQLPAGELVVVEGGHSVDKNPLTIEHTIAFFTR